MFHCITRQSNLRPSGHIFKARALLLDLAWLSTLLKSFCGLQIMLLVRSSIAYTKATEGDNCGKKWVPLSSLSSSSLGIITKIDYFLPSCNTDILFPMLKFCLKNPPKILQFFSIFTLLCYALKTSLNSVNIKSHEARKH